MKVMSIIGLVLTVLLLISAGQNNTDNTDEIIAAFAILSLYTIALCIVGIAQSTKRKDDGTDLSINRMAEYSKPIGIEPVKVQKNEEDKYDALKRIKELLDEGILTENEFNTKKQQILNS